MIFSKILARQVKTKLLKRQIILKLWLLLRVTSGVILIIFFLFKEKLLFLLKHSFFVKVLCYLFVKNYQMLLIKLNFTIEFTKINSESAKIDNGQTPFFSWKYQNFLSTGQYSITKKHRCLSKKTFCLTKKQLFKVKLNYSNKNRPRLTAKKDRIS